ncbi:hypothetical protein GCM10009087_27720 [Sphingomonas oligophenolica]|uniref:MFS transporter n=1 Tax=Sphingomonas oligophenolica TaxID=301154 RepID=A0ABU9Y4G5_9SPHN
MTDRTRLSTPLRVIAWIYLILGVLGLAIGTALCIGLGLESDPRGPEALAWIGFFFAIAAIFYLLPATIGGLGLLLGKPWARIPVAIVSVLLLFGFPIGTMLGGYALWAVVSTSVRAGGAPGIAGPPVPRMREPGPLFGLLVAMAGIGAGFVVVLWAGFTLHRDAMPLVIEQYHLPAILIVAAAITYGLYHVGRGVARHDRRSGARRDARSKHADWREAQRLRLIEMRGDPILSAYADRIERGESWSDAQIAYDLAPDMSATCAHLAPVELAMRRAGIIVKLQFGQIVHAACVIDEPALRARFAVALPAWYGIIPDYDRSYEDPPAAALGCTEHGALIYVIEPGQAPPGSPVFPA